MSNQKLTAKTKRLLKQAKYNEAKERADFARGQHVAFRRDHEQRQKRRRALLSLGRRVDAALARAEVLSDASAASLDRISRGKNSSAPPRSISGLLYGKADGSLREVYERRIRTLVEGLEYEIDAHKIRPLFADLSNEITEEIETRLIRDFEGEGPQTVAYLDPAWSQVKNPVHAIRQARIKHGRNPKDGKIIS